MSSPTILRHIHLPGITPFASAQALQSALVTQFLTHKSLLSSPTPPADIDIPPAPIPTILTFVPTPVYTTGRREQEALSPSQTAKLKQPFLPLRKTSHNPRGSPEWAEINQTLRGGQTTFHGPGQLVIYPILDLRSSFPAWKNGLNVRCYVHLLEQTTINTLSSWGLPSTRTSNPGVWEPTGEAKIAALGVHLRRNITSYGVGLNVNTDLRWFDRIIACGLEGKSVTSMLALGRSQGLWKAGDGVFSPEERQKWMRWVVAGTGNANGEIGEGSREEGPEIETAEDGRWKTKMKTAKQWRVRMKPTIVGRYWVREFARGLYGEGGEEKVVKVDVKDLKDVDDEVIGRLVRPVLTGRKRIIPEQEEEELIRTMD